MGYDAPFPNASFPLLGGGGGGEAKVGSGDGGDVDVDSERSVVGQDKIVMKKSGLYDKESEVEAVSRGVASQ